MRLAHFEPRLEQMAVLNTLGHAGGVADQKLDGLLQVRVGAPSTLEDPASTVRPISNDELQVGRQWVLLVRCALSTKFCGQYFVRARVDVHDFDALAKVQSRLLVHGRRAVLNRGSSASQPLCGNRTVGLARGVLPTGRVLLTAAGPSARRGRTLKTTQRGVKFLSHGSGTVAPTNVRFVCFRPTSFARSNQFEAGI